MATGYQSEVGAIKQLLLKHPREAFVSQANIDRQWQELNYDGRPDLAKAIDEYDRFVALLERCGIAVHFIAEDGRVCLDSIYTRDASIACDKGMILCNMGKVARRHEPAASETAYRSLSIPVHGAITGGGRIEGGDVVWIDQRTLVVGRGYRTNDEGIRQLAELVADCADEIIVAHLPHWRGPDDVFHLMSILSPVDEDLALVYSPLMPVLLREALLSQGIELIEVPDSEFDTIGCNVLAVAPRVCVMLDGNPKTRSRLEQAGATVYTYQGQDISIKGAGGPTCLTRPILRKV